MKISRHVAVGVGMAGVVAVGLSSLGAGGAVAGPLPGGVVSKTLVDGTPVTVQLFDEHVNVQRAVTNVATSREAWLSGKVKVTVGGKAQGGMIHGGYLVGCQVNFGAGANGGAGVSVAPGENGGASATPSGKAGAGLTLGPGESSYVPVISTTSGDSTAYKKYNVSGYKFKGATGGVAYSQEKFGLDGCAGYASAKAKIRVTVNTDAVKGVITLYGKPFSLG